MATSFQISSSPFVKLPNARKSRNFRSTTHKSAHVVYNVSSSRTEDSRRSPRKENVPGEFFVDHTCIDCDTCRWMAPSVFSRVGTMSAVHHQPENDSERLNSLQALLACPTASIHVKGTPKDIKEAHQSFPIPVDEDTLPGIFHCGYHSRKSFGATSYFLQRKEGNVLIDSPRYNEQLARRLEDMGGVQYLFLTHRDDVADHDSWKARFNCVRIIHNEEVDRQTQDVEMKLEGSGPWNLGSDIEIHFTPGHTEGSSCLLHHGCLFSGDHIAADGDDGNFTMFLEYNSHSVSKQIDSVKKLLGLEFVWLLPGHGRRFRFDSVIDKDRMLKELIVSQKISL